MKILILFFLIFNYLHSETYLMCEDCEISTLNNAFQVLTEGDTLFIEDGIYSGGNSFRYLKGKKDNWINIIANPGKAIFDGGNTAFQISDFEYVRFKGISIQNQKLNGVNVDDAGSFDTPSHHIIFSECIFKDIDNTGNNDLLKLSGLDTFLIESCTFTGGADGGSGADMVGCHSGTFLNNYFGNMGSNAIQCKGGTSEILIERNMFVDAGRRGINLGGSTGLDFFRPQGANYEARNLKVYSNIFIGSEAALAYVVSENVEVINNTIIRPDKWVFRILQEQQNFDAFIQTQNNSFINNIVLVDEKISFNSSINIGANTLPQTFDLSNNIWHHLGDDSWRPNLPVDSDTEIYLDPLLEYINPKIDSPVQSAGKIIREPKYDFYGNKFNYNRSIGAVEIGEEFNSVNQESHLTCIKNGNLFYISSPHKIKNIRVYNLNGEIQKYKSDIYKNESFIILNDFPNGIYLIEVEDTLKKSVLKIVN